jgi:cysteine-S-conjugate beta-lyase
VQACQHGAAPDAGVHADRTLEPAMSRKLDPNLGDATWLVHGGRDPSAQHGFVNTPVYRGSTVLFPDLDTIESYRQPYTYGRKGNPSMAGLEEAICHLEGGARTMLQPSGLGAVTTAILSVVSAGDHMLVADTVYRPARQFCDGVLKRLGVDVTYFDPLLGAGVAALMLPNTRVIYAESPGSQTFEVMDIPAVAAVAKAHDCWLLVDNTWASPLYSQPLKLGADLSIQAATKYVVGHADAMLGAITANERAAAHLRDTQFALGTCAGSEEVYLGTRGLRTMGVRLAQHHRSGLAMAEWLLARPEVQDVLHPALPSFKTHALWRRDFSGASGLFTVLLKPVPRTALAAMLDGLTLFGMGYSWGGFESLMVPFDPRPMRTATPWTGPTQALRFHIGLEDVDDLKRDLAAGFARLNAASV